MFRQMYARLVHGILGVGLLAFAAPMFASTNLGHPGVINYVEGQVSVNGSSVTPKVVGSADVQAGQVLETTQGKAEVLLTPGVLLRVGNESAVRMDNPGLTDTQFSVLKGEAMVEVNLLYKTNNIHVHDGSANVTLLKKGLYAFNGTRPAISVFDGEAQVQEDGRQVTVKKGKDLSLDDSSFKTAKFDRDQHDDLYNWSSLRSQYLAQASAESARTYVVNGGPWLGAGWYWNPWFSMYSFIPGDGFLYSPFGWGFYSPAYIGYSPFYSGRYYGRLGYVAPVRGRVYGATPAVRGGVAANVRSSGFAAHSFAGGGFGGHIGGGRGR